MKKEKVAVLTLNWNNKYDSVNCVKSLIDLSYCDFNIIFIDNNSHDDSIEAVIKILIEKNIEFLVLDDNSMVNINFTRAFIIKNPDNLGYTGGFNVGLDFVLKLGIFDYVWILNNDTTVEKDSLNKLLDCFKEYKNRGIKVGAIGTKLLYPDGNIQTICGNKLSKILGNSSFLKTKAKNLDYITGASLFLEVETLKKVGFFDERFFLYWDDADYCLRLKKMGYELICCDDAVVYHKEGGTAGRINKLNDYYWVRNGLLFTWKHQPIFLPFVILAYIFKYTVLRTIKRQPNNLSSLFLGIYHFFTGKFGKKP